MRTEKIVNTLTDDTTFSDKTKKILSIVFLLIAFGLTLMEYSGQHWWSKKITIKPDVISAIISLTMLLPLYMRGILVWRKSIYKLIVFVLLLSVFASLANIALQGGGSVAFQLLTAAVAFSWLGMRSIAGLGWVLLFIAAAYNLMTVSEAMGFFGFILIASAFLGLVFHADLAPEKLISEMLNEYRITTAPMTDSISSDVHAARDAVAQVGKLIEDNIKK